MTLPLLAVGAVGVIGVATHWCGPSMGEMIAAFDKGDVDAGPRAERVAARVVLVRDRDVAPNPQCRPR